MKTRKPTPLFPKPKAQSPKPNLNPLSLALAAATIIALAIGAIHAFRNLGLWLVVSDPEPERLDVIFTFGGGARYRVQYSRELYLRHPEAVWIVSGRQEVRYVQRMADEGLDTSRIVHIEGCTNTRQEIAWLRSWLDAREAQDSTSRVGLVSSPYHMRRIRALARRGLPESENYLLPIPFQKDHWDRKAYMSWWWDQGDLARLVVGEYAKLLLATAAPGDASEPCTTRVRID